jgi:transposase-like protein
VSVVARRHDVNTNQVFTWRRELLPKKSAALGDGTMVLVTVG